MRYPKPYYDACRLQAKIMEVLDSVATKDMANICKGYATLELLKLRIRMKPAPKPVDVSKKSSTRHRGEGIMLSD
jgi:hypothetical protein